MIGKMGLESGEAQNPGPVLSLPHGKRWVNGRRYLMRRQDEVLAYNEASMVGQ